MSKDFVQIADDVISGVRLLREGAPDLMKAFGAVAAAATTSKAVDTKTKELMALAIGIAVHCEAVSLFILKWPTSTGPPARRLLKRSLLPSTWEVGPRRYTEEMHSAPMIGSTRRHGIRSSSLTPD